MNQHHTYINFLDDHNEIDVLITDAIESPGVFSIKENDSIKAIILSFAYDKNKFKVVGPFVADNYVLSVDTFETLFKAMHGTNLTMPSLTFLLKKAFNNTNH